MDTARLAAIRAREQAATPGPWYIYPSRSKYDHYVRAGRTYVALHRWGHNEDAAFIAAARSDVPDLLAEIERLRAALARLRRRDHVRADDGTWAVCQYECQCGADEHNARIDALLSGGQE